MAYHVRRRLSFEEAGRVGPVVDVRDTEEGRARMDAVKRYIPREWQSELRVVEEQEKP